MTNIGVAEYQKIRRYVMNLILRSGGKSVQIPTIQELSEKFGVSRTTVSSFIALLTVGRLTPNFFASSTTVGIRTDFWPARRISVITLRRILMYSVMGLSAFFMENTLKFCLLC